MICIPRLSGCLFGQFFEFIKAHGGHEVAALKPPAIIGHGAFCCVSLPLGLGCPSNACRSEE